MLNQIKTIVEFLKKSIFLNVTFQFSKDNACKQLLFSLSQCNLNKQ